MNEVNIDGKWPRVKHKISRRWGKLTEADVSCVVSSGVESQLLQLLRDRYGYETTFARRELREWFNRQ